MVHWLSPDEVDAVTGWLDLAGVFICGVLGGVVARNEGLDLFGFLVVGTVSGLGGGLIRDTLLQHGTPVALTDPAYLPTAFAGALLAFVLSVSQEQWTRAFTALDAAVIGFWSVAGAQKTLAAGLGWLPAVLLGTITAVGGGAVRDLLLRRVPEVFGGNGLYATVAVAVSGVYVLCAGLGRSTLGIVSGVLLALVFRLLAHRRGWYLPQGLSVEPHTVLAAARTRPSWETLTGRQHPRHPQRLQGRKNTVSAPTDRVLFGLPGIRQAAEDFYKDLHAHPELGNHEHRTASRVAGLLRKWEYEVTENIGTTGVVGVLSNGDGPTVLLRADMDALPVREATGLPYASNATVTGDDGQEQPVMHACGHDVHVTCLLGFAQLMAGAKDAWQGTVVALFQPSEENGDGADAMVDGGLAGIVPKPDVALAQHVLVYPAGYVGVRRGSFLSAADSLRITLYGRGAHGSMPQAAVDPVVMAAMCVVRLQTIVSREIAATTPAVVSVGSIKAGTGPNVIPDSAVIELNVRTYDDATRNQVLDAVRRCVNAEAAASNAPEEPLIERLNAFPPTINDTEVADRLDQAFRAHFGDDAHTIDLQTASEDFSRIPATLGAPFAYWGIGGVDPDTYDAAAEQGRITQDIPVNHSPLFAPVIQPTLDTGITALTVAALTWLGKESA